MSTDLLPPALSTMRDLLRAYARGPEVTAVSVVGNAPLDPDPTRAAAIDAADLVLRVNSFVLDRPDLPADQACQGSRVDVVLWNRLTLATPYLFERYSERLYLLVEPMRMHGFAEMWPASWPSDLGHVVVPNREVAAVINAELDPDWRAQRLAPTTGLTAAWLAVTLFPEATVRLSGFSMIDDPEQTSWQHQWGDEAPVGREHRIGAEGRLLASWVDSGRVTLLR